jgi:hypothetical protein
MERLAVDTMYYVQPRSPVRVPLSIRLVNVWYQIHFIIPNSSHLTVPAPDECWVGAKSILNIGNQNCEVPTDISHTQSLI